MRSRYRRRMILSRITPMIAALAASLSLLGPAAAQVQENDASDIVKVSLLSGWREDNGTHFAALKFVLAPGWKTYWRAPGDGGVPTRLDWSGSTNLRDVKILWPLPEVFRQNGLRSVGYRGEFILPMAFQAVSGGPIEIDGRLDFGVCAEICLPVGLDLHMLLLPDQKSDVVEISAALQKHPINAAQAKLRRVACKVTYREGRARLDVEIDMPALEGKGEAMVLEPANPRLWVGEPYVTRKGDTLRATAEMATRSGTPFQLNLDQLRITVITTQNAVEIIGCP